MTDTRREFSLVFCPNDPNPKVKELIKVMAFSGQDLIRFLVVGQYRHHANVELSRLDRIRRAQVGLEKLREQPDLMRHYLPMIVRASEVAFFNTLMY